jgi:uncharacterized lipoprotein YajG
MKTILVAVSLLAAAGCANLKQMQQVDVVEAKVVKVDTVNRHPDLIKQITWKDQDDIQYISYTALDDKTFQVGSIMYVMRKR